VSSRRLPPRGAPPLPRAARDGRAPCRPRLLALNLVLGFALIRLLDAVTDHFVSVYIRDDATLLLLSALQGRLLRWWLGCV
jgi:hypothetical protein